MTLDSNVEGRKKFAVFEETEGDYKGRRWKERYDSWQELQLIIKATVKGRLIAFDIKTPEMAERKVIDRYT